MSKNLDPNIQPEEQNIGPLKGKEISQEKPRMGQGRTEMRRRRPPPINQAITQTSELSTKIPEVSKIEKKVITHPGFTTPLQSVNSPSAGVINRMPMIKDIPIHPDPTYRPSPKPTRIPTSENPENIDICPQIDINLRKILCFRKE